MLEPVKRDAQRAFNDHGATWDEFIVAVPQSAMGRGMGSGLIAAGDIVLFNFWPRDLESFCFADITWSASPRTRSANPTGCAKWRSSLQSTQCVPASRAETCTSPSPELFPEHGYPTSAQKSSGEVLRVGFFHGLCHDVGLAVHEALAVARFGHDLVPGDVTTLETGFYRYGYRSVRLEDLILVTGRRRRKRQHLPVRNGGPGWPEDPTS